MSNIAPAGPATDTGQRKAYHKAQLYAACFAIDPPPPVANVEYELSLANPANEPGSVPNVEYTRSSLEYLKRVLPSESRKRLSTVISSIEVDPGMSREAVQLHLQSTLQRFINENTLSRSGPSGVAIKILKAGREGSSFLNAWPTMYDFTPENVALAMRTVAIMVLPAELPKRHEAGADPAVEMPANQMQRAAKAAGKCLFMLFTWILFLRHSSGRELRIRSAEASDNYMRDVAQLAAAVRAEVAAHPEKGLAKSAMAVITQLLRERWDEVDISTALRDLIALLNMAGPGEDERELVCSCGWPQGFHDRQHCSGEAHLAQGRTKATLARAAQSKTPKRKKKQRKRKRKVAAGAAAQVPFSPCLVPAHAASEAGRKVEEDWVDPELASLYEPTHTLPPPSSPITAAVAVGAATAAEVRINPFRRPVRRAGEQGRKVEEWANPARFFDPDPLLPPSPITATAAAGAVAAEITINPYFAVLQGALAGEGEAEQGWAVMEPNLSPGLEAYPASPSPQPHPPDMSVSAAVAAAAAAARAAARATLDPTLSYFNLQDEEGVDMAMDGFHPRNDPSSLTLPALADPYPSAFAPAPEFARAHTAFTASAFTPAAAAAGDSTFDFTALHVGPFARPAPCPNCTLFQCRCFTALPSPLPLTRYVSNENIPTDAALPRGPHRGSTASGDGPGRSNETPSPTKRRRTRK